MSDQLTRNTLDSLLEQWAPTGKLAEDTLHAIVLGEADAIVIETKDGPRVYTLKDASEPYRHLVERMSEAAVILDDDGTIIYCNGRLAAMVGRDGLAGGGFLDLVVAEQRGQAARLLASGAEFQAAAEMALVAADGQTVAARVTAGPMAFDDRPAIALVVTALDDIAALKTAKAEAERANAAKSHFLAAASHDLRQPFQALRLYVDLLAGMVKEPRQQKVLKAAGQALANGESLLGALLDVSQLDAGAVAVHREIFPLGEAMRALAAESEAPAEQKGITFTTVPSSIAVESDPVLLSRLLRNLLHNAIKYTERGRVLFGARRVGGGVRIEVWDTGIGIAADQVARIFDDFYQVGNAGRDQSMGLGIGLPVVRRTATLLGHAITVKSIPGRGSVFAVTIGG